MWLALGGEGGGRGGFFFSSGRRHTRWPRDWSSDVCSSDLPGGGGLERCRAGVRSELRFAFEAMARAEDGGQLTSGQQVDADQLCQWCEAVLSQSADPLCQPLGMLEGDSSTRRESPHRGHPLTLQRSAGGDR